MKTKAIIAAFLVMAILTSCSSMATSIPDATTLPTSFFTVTPTATPVPVSDTPEATIPSPITFSGKGNAILTVNKWRGPALIHITYTGSGEFIAWNDNEKNRELQFILHVRSNYIGTQVLDMSDNEAFQTQFLEIYTNGIWEIEILPFEHGRKVSIPSVITGLNNDVVFIQGSKPSLLEIQIDESGNYFQVSGQGNDGFVPIIDGKPPYHGTVKIEQDLRMLIIEALGSWQIKVLDTSK